MAKHLEDVQAGHAEQNDTIEEIRHEAETGHTVLQQLSKVNTNTTPTMSFSNVIKATDTFTMLNCLALTVCYSTAVIAYLVPAAIITYVVADLGGSELSPWVSSASTAATAAVLPCMSSITDILGRRYALLFGCLLGVAGALVSGLAHSTQVVIIGQTLTGAAIGFTFVAAAAMAEIIPAFTRPFWQTLQHTCGTFGQTIGPVYGGAFIKAKASGWRWVFYIDGILYGIAFVLIFFLYRTKSRVKALGLTNKEVAKRFDYVGLVLFIGGTVSLLVGLTFGGDVQYGWNTSYAIAPTVVGLVVLVICLPLYEVYGAKWSLIDKRLFKNRNFVILNVQTFVMGLAEFGVNVYFPQLLVMFWKPNPLMLGVDRMPFSGSLCIAQTFSGMLLQKTGRYKWAFAFYAFCLLLGPAILAVLSPSQSIGVPIGLSIITGVGVGGATQLGLVAVEYSIPQQLLGISTGSINTMRSVGGAIGVAIYSSILKTKQNNDLPTAIDAAALKAGAASSDLKGILAATLLNSTPKLTQAAHGNMAVVKAAQHAYQFTVSAAYRVTFLATIPFGVIGLVVIFWLKEVDEFMSEEIVFGVKHDEGEGDHSKREVDTEALSISKVELSG